MLTQLILMQPQGLQLRIHGKKYEAATADSWKKHKGYNDKFMPEPKGLEQRALWQPASHQL